MSDPIFDSTLRLSVPANDGFNFFNSDTGRLTLAPVSSPTSFYNPETSRLTLAPTTAPSPLFRVPSASPSAVRAALVDQSLRSLPAFVSALTGDPKSHEYAAVQKSMVDLSSAVLSLADRNPRVAGMLDSGVFEPESLVDSLFPEIPQPLLDRYPVLATKREGEIQTLGQTFLRDPNATQLEALENSAKVSHDVLSIQGATQIDLDFKDDLDARAQAYRDAGLDTNSATAFKYANVMREATAAAERRQEFAGSQKRIEEFKDRWGAVLDEQGFHSAAKASVMGAVEEAAQDMLLTERTARNLSPEERDAMIQATQRINERKIQTAMERAAKEPVEDGFLWWRDGKGDRHFKWDDAMAAGMLGMMLYEGTIGEERKRKQARGDYLWRSQIELDSQMRMLNARAGHDMAQLQERASISPAQPQRGTPSGSVVSTPGFFR